MHARKLLLAGFACAALLFAMVGVALAWQAPTVRANCAPDANHYDFTITLAQESDYNMEWSFGPSGPWTAFVGKQGDNDLVTPRGTGDLFVRWASDHGSIRHATPNSGLCNPPTPSPTPPPTPTASAIESFQGETATPTVAPTPTPSELKVTLCHATDSDTNPYVVITVSINSVADATGVNGHGTHTGPIWYSDIPKHTQWGDIIPSFSYGSVNYPGLNWTADGQAIWNNGCNIPTPTATPTEAPTATPTEAPTATPTEAPTATPTEAPTATPTVAPTATPTPVTLTLIKVICPAYSDVPANRDPSNADATGGHWAELDTSYQTTLVDPATDIPTDCVPTSEWGFKLNPGGSYYSTYWTGAGGSVDVTLDSTLLAAAQAGSWDRGIQVVEVVDNARGTFGALRCYRDILNGDNLDSVYGLQAGDTHIYCIAYNVAIPESTATPTEAPTATPTEAPTATPTEAPTATPTEAPTATPTEAPTATPTEAPTATPTPFESFEGQTATPTVAPTATPTPVTLTLIKVICPAYSDVPANRDPSNADATGGHWAELDTSYQTTLVDPATDIPTDCVPASEWGFKLNPGGSYYNTYWTGAAGSVDVTLDSTLLAAAQAGSWDGGIQVVEVVDNARGTFGALRCYRDILNGDNLDSVYGLQAVDTHIYCIAYNVAIPQATPTASAIESFQGETATPVVTSSPVESLQGETATPVVTSSPVESFQGETATPAKTATPPPTTTGRGSSGNSSTPLMVMLICLAFGGLGLAAVEAQRRTIRR
jgi:hypothetical protein